MDERAPAPTEPPSALVGSDDQRAAQPRIQSIGRGVRVLLAIAESDNGLAAREIAERTGLKRQVVYHILQSLTATGLVTKAAPGRYLLGLKAGLVAQGFHRHFAPPERLAPVVRRIAGETGETAYAVGWIEGEIVALATARGREAVSAAEVPQGQFGFAHARASGKVLLANADEFERVSYLASHELQPLTKNTITRQDDLLAELARIRAQGYAVDDEEFWAGLCCLAVPIRGLGARYALAISVPSDRFRQNWRTYLAAMTSAAEF